MFIHSQLGGIIMKLRVRRITALCMAALLFAGSGSLDPKVSYVHAEEAVEASAETTAETQPQTQAPTEAPPPETQAPTEAPPPETQAPTEAPPPETQAPTEAPPETQAETAAETVQTETQGSSEEDLLASEEQNVPLGDAVVNVGALQHLVQDLLQGTMVGRINLQRLG